MRAFFDDARSISSFIEFIISKINIIKKGGNDGLCSMNHIYVIFNGKIAIARMYFFEPNMFRAYSIYIMPI